MKIDLHIERLVLEHPAIEGSSLQLRTALQDELAHLLTAHGLSHQLRRAVALPYLAGANLELNAHHRPMAIGRSIARAIHASIGNSTEGKKR